MASLAIDLPRRMGLALFRLHIENGVAVSLAMAIVGWGFFALTGQAVAVLAATGAMCVSIVDQPGPRGFNIRVFAAAIAGTAVITLLAALAGQSPWLLGFLIAAMSAGVGLVSAYGRRALGLGVATVLALMFGMASPAGDLGSALLRAAIFAGGGAAYALIAILLATMLDDRNRRLFLAEALRAFAGYLQAKMALYETGRRDDALKAAIEAHANLNERIQSARDMLFAGRRTKRHERWAMALVALLDCFELMVATDADIETLQGTRHHHLMQRIRALIGDLARDTAKLELALSVADGAILLPDRSMQLQAIADEIVRVGTTDASDADMLTAFRSTQRKLARAVTMLTGLSSAISGTPDPNIPQVTNLPLFMQAQDFAPRVALAQMRLSSPTFRYASRLTLAMTAAYALTLLLPGLVHGGWVLLTTALIMRANYSVTRQRGRDRVLGNLAGSFVAVFLIRALPPDALFPAIVIAIGIAHAFAAVDYRITAFSACIMALLQLHFLAPLSQPLPLERLLDTVIGAGLALAFSFVLPYWEWKSVPRLVAALCAAAQAYAGAALKRAPETHAYRLARKRANDAAATLAMTARRLVSEPGKEPEMMVKLGRLLNANYLFNSDLASVQVALQRRKNELDPGWTDGVLAETLVRVHQAFAAPDLQPPATKISRRGQSQAGLESEGRNVSGERAVLRRLVHVERTAQTLARLAKAFG